MPPANRTKYNRARYQHLRDSGLCIRCGKACEDPEKTRCAECRAYAVRDQAKRVQGRRDTGKCPYCGTDTRASRWKFCEPCREARRAKYTPKVKRYKPLSNERSIDDQA